MTITLDLASDLERDLRQAAERVGLAPAAFVAETLRQRLQHETGAKRTAHVSAREADLLLAINRSFDAISWPIYRILIEKREAEQLTPEEHQQLLQLVDQVEIANSHRIAAAAQLAQLRGTTLPKLLDDLGLFPAVRD